MQNIPTQFGGIVLCGGNSRRMGQPKLSLRFGTELMLQRIVRILEQVVSPIVVVAAAEQVLPQLPSDVEILRDETPGLGPLGGLVVGLKALRQRVDAAFVTSCDAPLLKSEFVQHLVSLLGRHDLVISQDGKYYHPLAAVYRTQLEDKVRSLIAQDRMRPFFLVEESNSRIVKVDDLRSVDPELHSLWNINTPDDYQKALEAAELVDSCEPNSEPQD
jgi:molybdopterin-guanine dinucleotide biosynthesis protein A